MADDDDHNNSESGPKRRSPARGGRGSRQKLGRDPLSWMQQQADDSKPETGAVDNSDAEVSEPTPNNEGSTMATTTTKSSTDNQEKVTLSRAELERLTRFQITMDNATTAIMKTDAEGRIEYANEALIKLLTQYEQEIAQENRGFRGDQLVDEDLASLFPQLRASARQMGKLRDQAMVEQLQIGDVHFRLAITGDENREGEFLGNTLEWFDETEDKLREEDEAKAREDIAELIRKVNEGRLDERMDTSEMEEGFVKKLSEDINTVIDAAQQPTQEVVRIMKLVADGNLREKMQGDFKGDFGRLQDAVNESIDALRNIVDQVMESTGNIDVAAKEISQGNQDLSQRTEEQASSLEETASSMEEMTSTVKQNADNAQESNQLATAAREKAERGGTIAKQVVKAMGDIKSSSSEISDIITVIDEIAFQTNLLALNAAVEAARAGEHGRGFGVVAAEVRNLAQRSASAAKDIKKLIKNSTEKVEHGTKLVDESTETLDDIISAVKTVTDKIAEIAAASEQQSAGIDEINKAVTQLDEVTQQNAALVEEAAAAAESLDEQSGSLVDVMSFFGEAASKQAQQAKAASNGRAARPTTTAHINNNRRKPVTKPAPGHNPKPRPQHAVEDDSEWEEF